MLLHENNVIHVIGPLNDESQPLLQQLLDEQAASDHELVRVNLTQCQSINSPAISSLLRARDVLSDDGRTLTISGCSDELFTIFTQLQLTYLLEGSRAVPDIR